MRVYERCVMLIKRKLLKTKPVLRRKFETNKEKSTGLDKGYTQNVATVPSTVCIPPKTVAFRS